MWWKVAKNLKGLREELERRRLIYGAFGVPIDTHSELRHLETELRLLRRELQECRVLDHGRVLSGYLYRRDRRIDLERLEIAVNAFLDAAGLDCEWQEAGWHVVKKAEPDAEA